MSWLCRLGWGILVLWAGVETVPPAVGAQSLNHWTAREVLLFLFLAKLLCLELLVLCWIEVVKVVILAFLSHFVECFYYESILLWTLSKAFYFCINENDCVVFLPLFSWCGLMIDFSYVESSLTSMNKPYGVLVYMFSICCWILFCCGFFHQCS